MMRHFALLPLVALAACAVGPNYVDPRPPVPPAFTEARAASITTASDDPAQWWHRFGDPELDRLIGLALRGNLDVQSARTRIAAARAQEREALAARLPTLDAQAGLNRVDFSKNAGISSLASAFGGGGSSAPSGQGIALPGSGITTFSLGLDASWELDLFGGVQRSIEGARARTAAAEWNVRDLQVSLAAEVASDYLMLRSLQNQTAIARAELARQQATLRLVSARRQVGLVAELPVSQQSLQLSNVTATLPQLEARAREQIHALGVLAGDEPGAWSAELTPVGLVPPPPPTVPVGLPSDLLRRRPDIRV
ncbi:MAG: TolC family protein, partial [Janthinobacterium lividum]